MDSVFHLSLPRLLRSSTMSRLSHSVSIFIAPCLLIALPLLFGCGRTQPGHGIDVPAASVAPPDEHARRTISVVLSGRFAPRMGFRSTTCCKRCAARAARHVSTTTRRSVARTPVTPATDSDAARRVSFARQTPGTRSVVPSERVAPRALLWRRWVHRLNLL